MNGQIVEFKEYVHEYLPFVLSRTDDNFVYLRDNKNKESKLKVFDITFKKLQLKSFDANSATFKDIYSSKIYVLEKDKKLIRFRRALVNYLGTTHKVRPNGNFFGYRAVFSEQEILFTHEDRKFPLNEKQKMLFLPGIKNHKSKHRLENCPCIRR